MRKDRATSREQGTDKLSPAMPGPAPNGVNYTYVLPFVGGICVRHRWQAGIRVDCGMGFVRRHQNGCLDSSTQESTELSILEFKRASYF
jgi:hypothetical protein